MQEQIRFFEILERFGIAFKQPALSIFKCDNCNLHTFDITLSCTLCSSHKIVKGIAIEHDLCENVDFEHEYKRFKGNLICPKCDTKLNAIGVDYSVKGYLYKCLTCRSLLPNINHNFKCLQCSKDYVQDDVRIQDLFTYTVDPIKLSELLKTTDYILSVVEELDRFGIRSAPLSTVTGISKIQHNFALVVYDEQDTPIVAVDTLESQDENKVEETSILTFIARCLDTRVQYKILVSIPGLKEDLKALAISNGIHVIESPNSGEAELELINYIQNIYNTVKN